MDEKILKAPDPRVQASSPPGSYQGRCVQEKLAGSVRRSRVGVPEAQTCEFGRNSEPLGLSAGKLAAFPETLCHWDLFDVFGPTALGAQSLVVLCSPKRSAGWPTTPEEILFGEK